MGLRLNCEVGSSTPTVQVYKPPTRSSRISGPGPLPNSGAFGAGLWVYMGR